MSWKIWKFCLYWFRQDISNGISEEGIFEWGCLVSGTRNFPCSLVINEESGKFNEYNQLHGEGTRIYSNGEIESGRFENGILVESHPVES